MIGDQPMGTITGALTTAALVVMLLLSLIVCLIGVVAAVGLGMLAVSAAVDIWQAGRDVLSQRGRRRARLLRRLSQRNRTDTLPQRQEASTT